MSSDTINLSLDPREVTGKKIKSLRDQQIVPAVIYNHGTSTNVSVAERDILRVWRAAGKHHPVQITLGNEQQLALIKEVDFEPLKHQMRHVVFGVVRRDEKTEAEVPIVLDGDAPAERAGLIVNRQLDQVEVKAFPQDIPDEFAVDAALLAELHDKVLVGDLKVPADVEILTDDTLPIFVVDEPRAHAAAEEAEESAESEEGSDAEAAGESSEAASESAEEE